MTAADRPSVTPRVGDLITTAAQVRDLPTGVVVRTHNGILCEADGVGLVTPSWYAQGRALEARYLPATVLYVPGERSAVCRHCGQFIDPEGFADDGSSNCAASQEGPVDDLGNVPHDATETVGNDGLTDTEREEYARQYESGPAFRGIKTPLAAGRVETTTATTEKEIDS